MKIQDEITLPNVPITDNYIANILELLEDDIEQMRDYIDTDYRGTKPWESWNVNNWNAILKAIQDVRSYIEGETADEEREDMCG